MATEEQQQDSPAPADAKAERFKLRRALPTDRLKFEKQVAILKAYAAESRASPSGATTLDKVAKVAEVAATTVGLNNEFFREVNLLVRENKMFRPTQPVIDFLQASQWDPANALRKIGPTLADSWAGRALTSRVAVRDLTKGEAIALLADESGASKEHAARLEILLDFLNAAGVVDIEGNAVRRHLDADDDPSRKTPPPPPQGSGSDRRDTNEHGVDDKNDDPEIERFTIPIPGKRAATITVPKDLDDADWQMLHTMIDVYITRLQKKPIAKKNVGGADT
jgi:hypothetical protein